MRILIGIPTYNRTLDIEIAKNLVLLERSGVDFDMVFPVSSHISRNRNYIVHQFLASNCDYLLFWDADIAPEEGFLKSMVNTLYRHSADVVGGCYKFKDGSDKYVLGNKKSLLETGGPYENLTEYDLSMQNYKPFEVDAVGTGMMLIRRNVLELLKEPWFTIVDKQNLEVIPEDFRFCNLAMEMGCKIMADPTFRLKHYGFHAYESSR